LQHLAIEQTGEANAVTSVDFCTDRFGGGEPTFAEAMVKGEVAP
jgi:hypothetical protein